MSRMVIQHFSRTRRGLAGAVVVEGGELFGVESVQRFPPEGSDQLHSKDQQLLHHPALGAVQSCVRYASVLVARMAASHLY